MAAIDYLNAKGWLKDGERKLLFELASQLPAGGLALNIGIEYGASLACLMAGVEQSGARVIGYDVDCSKVLAEGYGAEFYEQDSHEVVKTWAQPLDLIFVDGDHGKLGVLLDAQFADWLNVGGHILFQDCFDYDDPSIVHRLVPGVNEAVEEWFSAHRGEFVEFSSVETTRVFRRIYERKVTTSRHTNTDLRAPSDIRLDDPALVHKSNLRGRAKHTRRGR